MARYWVDWSNSPFAEIRVWDFDPEDMRNAPEPLTFSQAKSEIRKAHRATIQTLQDVLAEVSALRASDLAAR